MFFVVADKVKERKTIMSSDKVYGMIRFAPVGIEQIFAACKGGFNVYAGQ